MKERLDKLLVERALAPTREKAQALILAGKIRVEGAPVSKAGQQVERSAVVEVLSKEHPFVSRGGVKLEAALREFGLDPTGWTCLDVGASTGGFTHCLLLHGAARVFAVDVGYGQLDWEVRSNPRVTVLERTNIRTLPPGALGCQVHLAVIDVSFISLALVLQNTLRFVAPGGWLLALVKPQFEAGRRQVQRGGRVTDPQVHADVLARVEEVGSRLGLTLRGRMASPIVGKKKGNREFLVLWQSAGQAEGPSPSQPALGDDLATS